VTSLISGPAFADFVLSFEHTAFRLELRERYNEPEETEHVARFLAGEPSYEWNEDWASMIRQRSQRGQRITRVRVVTEPHSDYTRFGLDLARINAAAGEDIRYLSRTIAERLDLPGYDFWLIDSSKVGILRFGRDDMLMGAEVVIDPPAVARHCYWRDAARRLAVPVAEYVQ
jgi:hypothetical protein